MDFATLTFINRVADTKHEFLVEREATHDIARWYGAYHSGDDYDVLIDGEPVEKDINGEIK